jgi:hypothetical protein
MISMNKPAVLISMNAAAMVKLVSIQRPASPGFPYSIIWMMNSWMKS